MTWEQKRLCEAEQRDWKLKHWQKIDVKQLQQATGRQKEQIELLPSEVAAWDVYQGMIESTIVIEQCLPLVKDLNHPAMRTRHWKQLVRVTGGLLQTDTDSLRKMILGDLLELGLQKHAEEVKSIVQRAVKDLTIESSLKTCEEVWLGKVFEVHPHSRGLSRAQSAEIEAGSEITGSEMMPHAVLQTYEGSRTTGGTRTKSMKSGPHSRSSDKTGPGSVSRGRGGGRTSVLSLPISLVNLVDDPSPICLLRNVEKIFAELEHHQVDLNRMQSNSAIGSFLDEVTKWQKKLQLVEAVLEAWVSVQEKWIQLDDIYSGADVRTALAHEANMFAVISKDFRLLMRATEKNTNVLQSCSRKGLLPMLEKMDAKMDQCKHALLGNLERRRQRFPRFYFLSPEDVMNIVCYGYDLNAVNKFLCKVLPNLKNLIFEEREVPATAVSNKLKPPSPSVPKPPGGNKKFLVNGVNSIAGEQTMLSKPLPYEGPMSQWLPRLIEGLKFTIQEQLHVALGFEPRPAQIERELRSAGASKVRVSRPSSAASQRSGGSNKSVIASDVAKALEPLKEGPSDMAAQLSHSLGVSVTLDEVSWTLDNTTQVTLLATSVQASKDISAAVKTDERTQESIKVVHDKLQAKLDGAVIMLKGMEDERTSRMRSARFKSQKGKDKTIDGTGGKKDGFENSESLGAPSTRLTLEDDVDMAGDDVSIDDGMGGGDAAPINTMQSLLFMEQIQSNTAKGMRRDTLELELADILPKETTEPQVKTVDTKLQLFPSQIHKIAGMITLLAQYRDICLDLMKKPGDIEQSFEYQSRLHHVYNDENMEVSVHLLNWEFEYGYEYQGSSMRYIISPSCDRVILSLCHALHTQSGIVISRQTNANSSTSRSETLQELSIQMGRALYTVCCSASVDHYMLGDLFKGLAETGCWLCLEGMSKLAGGILSVACQLASDVLQALRSGQQSLVLQSEEVAVSPHAAFFATVDYSEMHFKAPRMFSPYPTATAQLPPNFLKNFRIISACTPDRRTVLEIRLLAQGFTQASEISHKLCIFLQLSESFFSTLPGQLGKSGMPHETTGNNVLSLHSMELIIASAGISLDSLIHDHMEKNKEYKEMISNKTRKFAELWRHKASTTTESIQLDSSGETDEGGNTSSSNQQKSDSSVQREEIEEDIEAMRRMEEEAIVTAIKNYIVPRITHMTDRNLLATLIQDLYPEVDIDLSAENEVENEKVGNEWGPDMDTEVSIPVHPTEFESQPFQSKTPTGPTSNMDTAISAAIIEKKLYSSAPFLSKVNQMIELADSMRGVIVTGRPGSGKSTCVDVYAETQKQLGANVNCKRIFLNAMDSPKQLFGYYDQENKEWKDGLVQHLVRPGCFEKTSIENSSTQQQVFILHVDGILNSGDTDMFLQLLRSSGPVGSGGEASPSRIFLPNNERLRLSSDLRVVWEMDSLAHLAPSTAAELGVLAFGNTEITWKVHLYHWLDQLPEMIREVLRDLLELYLPKVVGYFSKGTMPDHLTSTQPGHSHLRLRQMVKVGVESMTITFCRLLNCLLTSSSSFDMSQDECERYVGYAVFWAFGGTLESDSRGNFALWWTEQWPNLFPKQHDPWCVFVDSDTRDFAHWSDFIPQFSGFAHSGSHLSSTGSLNQSSQDEQQRQQQQDEVFVHTPDSGQMNHLLGMLTDAGHPVMIAGPAGCGKTALVRERVNTVSSGEVAEVLSLFIHCNRLTQAGGLWERVSNYLEWKHGITYTPRGNKKLLCVVDDLNLSKPLDMDFGNGLRLQSACEIIRQHLDTGGIRNISTFKWQQVSNVAYITTTNPSPSCSSYTQSQRLTRHFSVFTCPFPSLEAQNSIFSAMLGSHFLTTFGSGSLSSSNLAELWAEKPMQHMLHNITMVTIELQERLRSMYLSVPDRAHYLFTLNDLDRIFRNLILSLRKDCHHKDLLLRWRHECDWTYGRRMVSDVDLERYQQAFDTAVRKYLTENKYLPCVLPSKQPLFSSVRELDSGFVTAGRYEGRSSQASRHLKSGTTQDTGDYYKAVNDEDEVHRLLMEAVKEYNKVNVGMNLSLYKETISTVCRLARILQCPHKTGHTLLFGEGCPMLARLAVNLAGHLSGFSVRSLRPSLATSDNDAIDTDEARLAHFKQFMVNMYNDTGVKGEKIVLFLSDDRVLTDECLAVLEELVRHGAISRLFTTDEQTTIANSVRSEVTAAGLTYSRDAAWNFFQSTVMKNLRIVLVCSDTGKSFMGKSLEFPALFNHFNIIAMRPWSHEQLVEITLYHVQGKSNKCLLLSEEDEDRRFQQYKRRNRRPMDKKWMENVAHLLANMHIAVRQKAENKFYKLPGHVSNYAFEKLVLRFVSVFRARRLSIHSDQNATAEALLNIDKENAIAESLQRELDREKQVLEEHKIGTTQLLAQIGQDMVITEQQVLAVKQQIRKIRHLKKSQPEYKHAHEKAVFKAAAIIADTKKVVKEIDSQGLQELRALQKPDNDVEDLMACIIMIVKSPNSDLTWSKGAKRQMANLDRFIDELMNFDDSPLPQSTLDALEPTLEKETFTVDNLTAKAGGNAAAGALLRWVQGVVRYHSLMITKVKPLHDKLEETSSAIVGAQHRLRQLESKKEALESRLRDLGEGFEQATVDKNEQENKRLEMQDHLREAAHFQQVLMDEHRRRTAVLSACEDQLEWVTGVAAIAAGFSTYMGPYPYMFRRMLLTVDWAQCLVERGIPLVFDTIDAVRGHRIEFMLDVHDGIPDISGGQEDEEQEEGGDESNKMLAKLSEEDEEAGGTTDESDSNLQNTSTDDLTASESNQQQNLPPVAEETDADDEAVDNQEIDADAKSNKDGRKSTGRTQSVNVGNQGTEQDIDSRPSTAMVVPAYSYATLPYISTEEYQIFVGCIVKILVGEEKMQEWLTKDYSHHQLQNAAILHTTWQRPPLLLDPYLAGVDWYASVFCQDKRIVPVNLSSRMGQAQIVVMEKAILAGHTLMLMDCEQQSGNLLRPLIYHANTTRVVGENSIDETRTIRWVGRRLVCPDSFRLCMSTAQPASMLHPNIIAASQLISYIPSTETLQEDLLNRALCRVRPELFRERKLIMHAIRQHRRTLSQLDDILNGKLISEVESRQIENSTKFISSVVEMKTQVFEELKAVENLLANLNELSEELFPVAQRAALLYTICRAMPALDPHYQIPLPFFRHLFDMSVGEDSEEDTDSDFVLDDVKVINPYAEEEAAKDLSDDGTSPTPDKSALQERRRSKLRLGSASKVMKRGKKEGEGLSEDATETDASHDKATDGKTSTEEEDSEEELARKRSHLEIVIPTVSQFPTEGVEYSNYPSDDVKKIVDAVTARVFEHIYHSVQPDHRLHIAALTLLSIQLDTSMRQEDEKESSSQEQEEKDDKEEEDSMKKSSFSEEELTLLIHGNPGFGGGVSLSLQDFECQAPVPTWMSEDHWEDLLAFSVLPGPLEGICVQVAECADNWREWYECTQPEAVNLPMRTVENQKAEDGSETYSDFHKLLLIRTLRPDRFLPALEKYVTDNAEGTSIEETFLSSTGPDHDRIFKDVMNTLGIMIVLPDGQDPQIQATLQMNPVDAIRTLAGSCKVNAHVVSVGDGCQPEVTHAIEQAHAEDSWLVIDGLHYAPSKFFEDLQIHLARIGNISRQSGILGGIADNEEDGDGAQHAEKKSKAPRFLVWLTTRPSLTLPPTMTQYLYKLSWKSLIDITLSSVEPDVSSRNTQIFKSSLISSLDKIPEALLTTITESQASSSALFYAVCVCHCVALTGQCFGWHGLTRRYALSDSVLHQALSHIVTESGVAHCIQLITNLYDDVITCQQDQDFMNLLLEDVISQAISQPSTSKFIVHNVEIPAPPSTMSFKDYSEWLKAEMPDDIDMARLVSIHPSALQWKTTQTSEKLIEQLQELFTASQQPGYETSVAVAKPAEETQSKIPLSLSSLQTSLEMCSEQLPTLLELGSTQRDLFTDYDFPYHRPSVLSTGIPHENPLPESIGFVLMKECVWFNKLLCHIYQQLYHLRRSLMLMSDYKLPKTLQETAQALLAENVPESWLHPNDLPSTHTLLTWLSDMGLRYKQFKSWIKEGMVPAGSKSPVGKLSSVWLGGLVNPQALITAMRHERAVAQDTTVEKVKLRCKVLSDSDILDSTTNEQEPSIVLKSMHTINMMWNAERSCLLPLSPKNKEMNDLPSVHLYTVLEDEIEGNEGKDPIHEFPVYMNVSRQVVVCHLPLPVDSDSLIRSEALEWNMQHASIVLQSGLDATKRDLCKTRTYLARKRREEWEKVSPEISELMSRSVTRMSSTHQSISGHPLSITSVGVSGQPKAGKRDSLTSQTPGFLQIHKKGKRGSIASSGDVHGLDAASKAKSLSQYSLSSQGSSIPAPSVTNKPPSRVQEEREEDGEDSEDKPIPNGKIVHKEPPAQDGTGELPSPGVAGAPPPGTEEAVERGVLPEGFFDIKRPPSTEASLLQSLMDEDGTEGDGSEGTQPSVRQKTDDQQTEGQTEEK
uniref:LOW QUALITY PROTEIN: dynein beta chain, ciliary-like n=1 Tax=Styela clava TaxID=7725 RepID=UPI0019398B21|nr:LOW QUALITY PROTEIN: dynein beta chain, ciliary-like [Styela clava]